MSHSIIFILSEVIAACKVAKAAGGENPLVKVFSIENLVYTVPISTRYVGLWCMANGRNGHMVVCFTKVRNHYPTINIQKYKVRAITDDQGCQKDALPSDVQTLEYYGMISYTDEFSDAEMHAWLANGHIIPSSKCHKTNPPPPNAIEVPNIKIASMMQTHDAKISPKASLANPVC